MSYNYYTPALTKGLTPVIVRCNRAGVHFGYLDMTKDVQTKDAPLFLRGSRRIWSWDAAFSCSELAQSGLKVQTSSVCATVDIILFDPIEVIPATEKAEATILKASC